MVGAAVWRSPGCQAIYTRASMDTDPPTYCTMFHHMVKNGGTAVRDQLILASEIQGRDVPGLCVIGPSSAEACLDALHHSSVIMGYVELLRDPMEELGRRCDYFTMMRHPIDRLVSAFYYCPTFHDKQVRPNKWCGGHSHPDPLTSRLLDFAREDWMCKAMFQLSFASYCPPGAFCEHDMVEEPPTHLNGVEDWSLLAVAEDVLLSYTAVGIFEEWELSMELFDAVISSPVQQWGGEEAVNPGPKSSEREMLLRWAHSSPEIRQAVGGDLLLYDLALSIFKRQTAEALGTVWKNGGTSLARESEKLRSY
ncbi:expressed unknown protein [Ectocarpus siliculosus]|uniref:Sulfotransferase domain-containing protein n=1 Tax=Ectocarpus siliculosus TaxID=2880 RepID=D8LHT4_ECTSI|nr:expressed unknown protein [Ectocarpus siliculosus]|eukprot:CBN74365.1 expressed unknown protein [Ectocarpus siliculosus]